MNGRAFAAGFAVGVVCTFVAIAEVMAETIERVAAHRARAAAPVDAVAAFENAVRAGMTSPERPDWRAELRRMRGHVR